MIGEQAKVFDDGVDLLVGDGFAATFLGEICPDRVALGARR
jgi:hypothetical protein